MSVLITGGNGQLGKALQNLYPDAIITDIEELDITNESSVANFNWNDIDTVFNAAAFTNVDAAEHDGYATAWKVNAIGPAILAKAARDHDLALVHISTDYVFDGSKSSWTETEIFNPLSVYGASKAAGDLAVSSTAPKHYIIRTSWVIGDGHNFVKTMLKLSSSHSELKIVNDQLGRPTFTPTLAEGLKYIYDNSLEYGTYNLTNSGEIISWADLAAKIFELSDKNISIEGISTEEYFDSKQVAARPLNSVLTLDKITTSGYSPNDWLTDLEVYLKGLKI